MAAPDYKVRFQDAVTLLNYGYAVCRLYEDKEKLPLPEMPVKNGVEDAVPLTYDGTFSYLSINGEDFSKVEKTLILEESLTAPVEPGRKAGVLSYSLGGKKLGELPVITDGSAEEARYKDYVKDLFELWLLAE